MPCGLPAASVTMRSGFWILGALARSSRGRAVGKVECKRSFFFRVNTESFALPGQPAISGAVLAILGAMIFAGFLSAGVLWTLGFLWDVLRSAARMGTTE